MAEAKNQDSQEKNPNQLLEENVPVDSLSLIHI